MTFKAANWRPATHAVISDNDDEITVIAHAVDMGDAQNLLAKYQTRFPRRTFYVYTMSEVERYKIPTDNRLTTT